MRATGHVDRRTGQRDLLTLLYKCRSSATVQCARDHTKPSPRGTVTNTTFKHYGNSVTEPAVHRNAKGGGSRGCWSFEEFARAARAEGKTLPPLPAANGH